MIYSHDGVKLEEKDPEVFHSKSEQGHSTQRCVFHGGTRFRVRKVS